MFRNVVVALNGSACAMRAFELAVTLGKVEGSNVILCTVLDPAHAMWSSQYPSAEQALVQAQGEADRIVREAIATAREAGLDVQAYTPTGDAASEIVGCAVATHADAIVMGTHGWSGIKHVVMGSVAETVLRSAPCPVIVVRDRV